MASIQPSASDRFLTKWRPSARTRVVAVVLAGLVALGLLVVWPLYANSQANQVSVAWAGRPSCIGTTVGYERLSAYDPRLLTIGGRPGMHCTIAVAIGNHGSRAITVDRVIAPYAGPGARDVVRAAAVDGVSPRRRPTESLDAVYVVHRVIEPGQTGTVRVALAFRPDGCSADGVFTVRGWPQVRMRVWGKTRSRAALNALHIRGYSRFSDCPG